MPGNENFGAIVFDRPESLDRGWYCLGEGEPGRLPDDGAAGLPPGPVWYTSLSFSEAAEMGLSSSSRFLNSAYLRQPMQKLLARLGVPDDDAGEQARVASVLFSRVMNACRSLSGRQDFLPARFLKGGLRVLMDPAPDPCVLKEDAERLDNALSYSHRCLTPGPRSAPPGLAVFLRASPRAREGRSGNASSGRRFQARARGFPASAWLRQGRCPCLARRRDGERREAGAFPLRGPRGRCLRPPSPERRRDIRERLERRFHAAPVDDRSRAHAPRRTR